MLYWIKAWPLLHLWSCADSAPFLSLFAHFCLFSLQTPNSCSITEPSSQGGFFLSLLQILATWPILFTFFLNTLRKMKIKIKTTRPINYHMTEESYTQIRSHIHAQVLFWMETLKHLISFPTSLPSGKPAKTFQETLPAFWSSKAPWCYSDNEDWKKHLLKSLRILPSQPHRANINNGRRTPDLQIQPLSCPNHPE